MHEESEQNSIPSPLTLEEDVVVNPADEDTDDLEDAEDSPIVRAYVEKAKKKRAEEGMKNWRKKMSAKALKEAGLCGMCRLPKRYCPCGRPSVMNEMKLAEFEACFRRGMSVVNACVECNVSEKTYRTFEQAHPEWSMLRKEWQSLPAITARGTMVDNLKDPRWASWWLERKESEEFGRSLKADGPKLPTSIKINLIGTYPLPEETINVQENPILILGDAPVVEDSGASGDQTD